MNQVPPILQPTDNYESQPRSISKMASLKFYWKLIGIVLRAYQQAKTGTYNDQEWIKSSYEVISALESVGCVFKISGRKNFLELKGPCVFVANHMSTLETFVLPCLIHPFNPITFIVKKSLLHYPIFKYVMRSREPIAVTRKNPRQDFKQVITQGQQKIAQGLSIVVFPQTTRTPYFDPKQFNSIGVKLAKNNNVPIIPIALKTDAWSIGKYIKEFGPIKPEQTIYFKFGRVIEAQQIQTNPKQAQQTIIHFIQNQLKLWTNDQQR